MTAKWLGTGAKHDQGFINEFYYDNSGSDTGEFIEIAGLLETNLAEWSLVLYNGSNGTPYETIRLSGVLLYAGDGYGFQRPLHNDGIS